MILPAWKGFDQAFVDPLDELEALACIAKARARESQRESKKARESERQTDRQTEAQRQRVTETAHAQSSRLSSHGRKSPTRLQRTHVDCLSEQSTLDKPSALGTKVKVWRLDSLFGRRRRVEILRQPVLESLKQFLVGTKHVVFLFFCAYLFFFFFYTGGTKKKEKRKINK